MCIRDRFYTSGHERFSNAGQFSNFNLPQYYEIVQINGELEVIPYRSQGQLRDGGQGRELGSAAGAG